MAYVNGTSQAHEALCRRELATFLRARRDELQPQDVGLVAWGRRRVKGLRRHEVADLAAVSETWYTWIEQGRQIRISADMLDALARALKLDDDSWRYIRRLAGVPVTDSHPLPVRVGPDLSALLDDLLPSPAYITTSTFDLMAWNRAYVALFGQDPAEVPLNRRNALWTFYTSETLRAGLENWETEAQGAVARFRAETARTPHDERTGIIVAELSEASPEFRIAWNLHEVRRFVGHVQTIDNAKVGRIRTQFVQFRPTHQPTLILAIHRPSEACSRERLSRLLGVSESDSDEQVSSKARG